MSEPTRAAGNDQSAPTDDSPTAAQVDISASAFALDGLFERAPDAEIEIETAVATPADTALLGIECERHARAAIAAALDRDPAIAGVERFGAREGGWTYRVEWAGRARQLLDEAADRGITITTAWARDSRWSFRLLAPDRESLSRAHDAIVDQEYRPECKYVGDTGGETPGYTDLTEQQREALIAAFESGYYDIPREITAEALASSLDISHQALSERFRRAHAHLVGSTLHLEE